MDLDISNKLNCFNGPGWTTRDGRKIEAVLCQLSILDEYGLYYPKGLKYRLIELLHLDPNLNNIAYVQAQKYINRYRG